MHSALTRLLALQDFKIGSEVRSSCRFRFTADFRLRLTETGQRVTESIRCEGWVGDGRHRSMTLRQRTCSVFILEERASVSNSCFVPPRRLLWRAVAYRRCRLSHLRIERRRVIEIKQVFKWIGKLIALRQMKPLVIDRQEPPLNQRQE
jgi:hypothetical protein